jgi:hypothetical protein
MKPVLVMLFLLQTAACLAAQQQTALDLILERYEQKEASVTVDILSGRIPEEAGQRLLLKISDEKRACLLAHEEGQMTARRQLANGKLGLLFYGLDTGHQLIREKLLRERMGIESKVVGGCMVVPSDAAHADGYNEVMLPTITAKFGSDALAKLNDEIQSNLGVQVESGAPLGLPLWSQALFVVLGCALVLHVVHRRLHPRVIQAR